MRKSTNREFSKAYRELTRIEDYLRSAYPEALNQSALYDQLLLEDGRTIPGYAYCNLQALTAIDACKRLMFVGKREEIKESSVDPKKIGG